MMILKHDGTPIATRVECVTSTLRMVLGLMFRRKIPDDYAMVFVFPEPKSDSIHALFMRFPIDVIFLDEDKRVIETARLNPWTGYKHVKDVSYVIEMNAGTSDRYGLAAGAELTFDIAATHINDHV